jgi:hypothetical protein
MSEQPHEWTADMIKDWYGNEAGLAKAINAALAAAKQEGIDWADKQYYGVSGHERIRDLEQQLAAERERYEMALRDLQRRDDLLAAEWEKRRVLVDALAKVKEI